MPRTKQVRTPLVADGRGLSTVPPVHTVALPAPPVRPGMSVLRRLAFALGLVAFVAAMVLVDRGGYHDAAGGPIGVLDALYYATVSVTTTGYGDIIPVAPRARLVTTILITPARILFLIVLVGTTLEVLTERWRTVARVRRWRQTLRDHYIVCGFGTKGRSAVQTLLGQGIDRASVVVVDRSPDVLGEANAAGFATVLGDAARTTILQQAEIDRAAGVIVATDRDDAAVLVTLTAREANREATIVAAVREEENAHLLRQSGADSVITSAEASGRLLGVAMRMPRVAGILEDLLTVGQGLDVIERDPSERELGGAPEARPGELVMAVVRDDRTLRFDALESRELRRGDRIVVICARPEETA